MDDKTQKMPLQPYGPILTLEDVAKFFQVSKMTVLRWKKAFWITGFFKMGRRWFIRREDLDKAIGFQMRLYAK